MEKPLEWGQWSHEMEGTGPCQLTDPLPSGLIPGNLRGPVRCLRMLCGGAEPTSAFLPWAGVGRCWGVLRRYSAGHVGRAPPVTSARVQGPEAPTDVGSTASVSLCLSPPICKVGTRISVVEGCFRAQVG